MQQSEGENAPPIVLRPAARSEAEPDKSMAPEPARASAPRRKPTVVELAEPVLWAGELVRVITLQPMLGGIIRKVPLPKRDPADAQSSRGMAPDYYLDLASVASGMPPPFFDQLGAGDVLTIVNTVAELLGPTAGTTEPPTQRSR